MSEELDALGPLDGRYRSRVAVLRSYFSEAALIKYRVRVEVEYLAAIARTQNYGVASLRRLPNLSTHFKTTQLSRTKRLPKPASPGSAKREAVFANSQVW